MSAWLAGAYPWLKALHIISVIAWMAGLFYLPRLFVYHAEAQIGSDRAAAFAIMERRLLHGIMHPALAMVVVFGALLAVMPGVVDWHRGWVWAKLRRWSAELAIFSSSAGDLAARVRRRDNPAQRPVLPSRQ